MVQKRPSPCIETKARGTTLFAKLFRPLEGDNEPEPAEHIHSSSSGTSSTAVSAAFHQTACSLWETKPAYYFPSSLFSW